MKRVLSALLAAALFACAASYLLRPHPLAVYALDVGAGQCWIVRTPQNRTILIDCGVVEGNRSDPGQFVCVPALRRLGVNRIDQVWITGSQSESVSGLHSVLNEFDCGEVVLGPRAKQMLGERLKGQKLSVVNPGARAEFVENGFAFRSLRFADDGTALSLEYGKKIIAIVTALNSETRKALENLSADVWFIGYRAGRYAPENLVTAFPVETVISSGRIKPQWADYGLVKELKAGCDEVYQTGFNGGVIVETDGSSIKTTITKP